MLNLKWQVLRRLYIGKKIGREINSLNLILQAEGLGQIKSGSRIQLIEVPMKTINGTRHAQKEQCSNEEMG